MQLFVEVLPPTLENCGSIFSASTMTCATSSEENKDSVYDPDFCHVSFLIIYFILFFFFLSLSTLFPFTPLSFFGDPELVLLIALSLVDTTNSPTFHLMKNPFFYSKKPVIWFAEIEGQLPFKDHMLWSLIK